MSNDLEFYVTLLGIGLSLWLFGASLLSKAKPYALFVYYLLIPPAFEDDEYEEEAHPVVSQRAARQPITRPTFAPILTQPRQDVANLPAETRQHTLLVAIPGDGKTQTLNTMLVADLSRGCQVIVLNPQFTYYHKTDQPIDLRPVEGQFEVIRDEAQMPAALKAIYRIGKDREVLYIAGEDVGHHISVIIDEWPRIKASEYGDACLAWVQKIVREHRKCNVWVTLATQDALVETIGFKSGARAAFRTKLASGNVDEYSWRFVVGSTPKTPTAQGTWASDSGLVEVTRPTADDIADLADGVVKPFAAMADENDSAIDDTIALYSGYSSDDTHSIAWAERVKELTREGLSTRKVREQIGGDYNEICRLAREAREEIGVHA